MALAPSIRFSKHFELPVISCVSISELLMEKGFDIVSIPKNARFQFRWYDEDGYPGTFGQEVGPKHVIHLRMKDEALTYFRSGGEGFALVASTEPTFPDELYEYRARVIYVACSDRGEVVKLRRELQDIFMSMLEWENQLHFITETNGSLQSLLDVGASVFKSVAFLIGVDYNIVGHSTVVGYPNAAYRAMLEREGAPVVDAVADLLARPVNTKRNPLQEIQQEHDEWGNLLLSAPIVYNGSRFGALILVRMDSDEVSPGYLYQFRRFAEYTVLLAGRLWGSGVENDMPHYYFFNSLLKGENFSNAFIESSLHELGIPLTARFKVVAFELSNRRDPASVLAEAMRNMNGRRCFVVMYEDYMVGILHSNGSDAELSHRAIEKDIEAYLFQPYGIVAGMSQVFQYVTDLNMGLRQAKIALDCYRYVKIEYNLMHGDVSMPSVSFESAMPYYMAFESGNDKRFHEFCMSFSPLEKLLADDLKNGSKEFALLWYYLLYERNASSVGKRMYMHRNSVLYHIKQIEKRFDFDFDDVYCREKLVYDYRYLLMKMPEDVRGKLFD